MAEANEQPAEQVDTPVEEEKPEENIDLKIETAIKKAREQWDAENKKREELSKLSEDERAKAELEKTRSELEKQRLEFEREKLKYEAAKVLSQRNLPVEFVDYLIAEDNAATLERIKVFEKKFNKSVEEAVNAKLKGTAPSVSGKKTEDSGSFLKSILDNQIRMN